MTHDNQPERPPSRDYGPAAVPTPLVTQVLRVLRANKPVPPHGLRGDVSKDLLALLLSPAAFDAARVCADFMARRVSSEQMYAGYLPDAARALGVLWVEDEVSFATVTVGALRIQSLITALRDRAVPQVCTHSALIIVPEHEQHFLGLCVLAARLEEAGIDVEVSIGEPTGDVVTRAKGVRPDVIMFSCARAQALATVRETVQNMEWALVQMPPVALGGLIADGALRKKKASLKEKTGVDIVTCDLNDVIQLCRSDAQARSRA